MILYSLMDVRDGGVPSIWCPIKYHKDVTIWYFEWDMSDKISYREGKTSLLHRQEIMYCKLKRDEDLSRFIWQVLNN